MNLINPTILERTAAAAKAWRLEEEPQIANHGYVLFYRGQPCGWTRDIIDADAYKWVPGVLAVGLLGLDGPIYRATGGNEQAGAAEWVVVWDPSPTYQPSESRAP